MKNTVKVLLSLAIAAAPCPVLARGVIDPTKLDTLAFKDMRKPNMSLEAARAAALDARERANGMLAQLEKVPVEFAAVLMVIPYASEQTGELINPSKQDMLELLERRDRYWSEVAYTLLYHRAGAQEKAQEGLKSLAAQQGLALEDGGLFTVADDLVTAGTQYNRLLNVALAIASDIRADRAMLVVTRGDGSPYQGDGQSIIKRKTALHRRLFQL